MMHRTILLICLSIICMVFVGCVHTFAEEKIENDSEMYENVLLPVNVNGKWGYINTEGDIVISPQYEGAKDFVLGIALVLLNDVSEFIDLEGEIVQNSPSIENIERWRWDLDVLFQLDSYFERYVNKIERTIDGYSVFHIVDNGSKLGIKDANGNVIITPKYRYIRRCFNPFYVNRNDSEVQFRVYSGAACISTRYEEIINDSNREHLQDCKVGLVSGDKSIFIEPKYNEIQCFYGGYAAVSIGGRECGPNRSIERNIPGCKWGIIDATGKEVIPAKYDSAEVVEDGKTIVYKNGKCGLIKQSGDHLIGLEYDECISDRKGFIEVVKNGKYGLIDIDGEVLIEPVYERLLFLEDGLFRIKYSDDNTQTAQWGLINDENEMIIQPVYDMVSSFVNPPIHLGTSSEQFVYLEKDGLYGFAKYNGEFVIQPSYEYISEFSDQVALIGAECKQYQYLGNCRKFGYIDEMGNCIISIKYDEAYPFHNGHAIVKKNDRFVLINKKEEIIKELDFLGSSSLNNYRWEYWDKFGLVIFRDERKVGVMNSNGEIVIPLNNFDIDILDHGLIRMKDDDKIGYADKSGHIFWPLQN